VSLTRGGHLSANIVFLKNYYKNDTPCMELFFFLTQIVDLILSRTNRTPKVDYAFEMARHFPQTCFFFLSNQTWVTTLFLTQTVDMILSRTEYLLKVDYAFKTGHLFPQTSSASQSFRQCWTHFGYGNKWPWPCQEKRPCHPKSVTIESGVLSLGEKRFVLKLAN
jgi:hypothetical protein